MRRRSPDGLVRRRTPFVWLPDQRMDHAAGFATLRGGPLRREEEGANRWVLARGRFTIDDGAPVAAGLSIAVDGRYRLWLDGKPLGRGPVRASPPFARYDPYRVTLAPGDHILAAIVHVPGVDLAWYETVKGGWQPVFGDGGLWACLEAGGRDIPIHWRLAESAAWRRDTPRAGWGQDFIEDFDARRLDPDWTALAWDDSAWASARAMVSLGNAAETARGFGRVEPFPVLLPSGIPPAAEEEVAPSRILWVRGVEPMPDQPLDARLYSETLLGDATARVDEAEALLRDDDAVATVRTAEGQDTALMLAFDPCHSGRPFIELDARGGEVIDIAVAEAVPGEFGRGRPGDGLSREGPLGVAHLFRYTARPGRQRFEKFHATAVRAMQVVVRNAPGGLGIRRIGSVSTHYPAAPEGAFRCSDPFLNRLWEVGRHTVLQCMHDSWVDCPGREARQWVGDAVVQFDIAALAFGPSIYPLQRQFLHQAAEGQRPDGLVRMFAPGDSAPDALTIPDFTLLWIIGAHRYVEASGDADAAESLLPSIERALGWFVRHGGEHGLLSDIPLWHFIEWADLDRRGESCAINALYAAALDAAARLAAISERPRLAERCRRLCADVSAALNRRHWDEIRGVYVDSVDPATGARRPRVSQHANALMLLFDWAPAERRERILAAITDASRLKVTAAPPIVPEGEPFDEESDIVRANSFFAHFVYSGIARAGGFAWVLGDMRAQYGPMLEAGATTLWESYAPAASLCHGFSATPVFQLSRRALGVEPLSAGYARFMVVPDPAGLEWARGAIPTPQGPISVAWVLDGTEIRFRVEHPKECRLETADHPRWRLLSLSRTDAATELRFEAQG